MSDDYDFKFPLWFKLAVMAVFVFTMFYLRVH
jgi:hypothetical protein